MVFKSVNPTFHILFLTKKEKMKKERKEGIVYVMSNPAFSYLKIGRASEVNQRLDTLSSTSVPFDFQLEYKIPVSDFKKVEKEVHEKLKEYRVNKNREFFEVTVEKARECIE